MFVFICGVTLASPLRSRYIITLLRPSPSTASVTRQDKTNFISQKDHKATYIAIKEYSAL